MTLQLDSFDSIDSFDSVESVVIGAGVIGLAIARALALRGDEVLLLEAKSAFGQGISSRNSEVLHGGIYYPANSLKARSCMAGHGMLRRYYPQHITEVGKLIVATSKSEEPTLESLYQQGLVNGVKGLRCLKGGEAQEMEPALSCQMALFSPHTAVLDVPSLLLSLLADAEAHGASLVLSTPVLGGKITRQGIVLRTGGKNACTILAQRVVVAAGLNSCNLMRSLGVVDVPQDYLCKGSYFSIRGKQPFRHLIYPVPATAGLGIHYTVDRSGQGRFGPDVEWVTSEDYTINSESKEKFITAISRYCPEIEPEKLSPLTCGIRPKIHGPNQPQPDFLLYQSDPRLVGMLGIESPGLTCCLSLADTVSKMLKRVL